MNWYFSNEELEYLPSLIYKGGDKQAYTKEQESEYRKSTASFIQQTGIALKVPQLTIATSLIYFHRFYTRFEFQKYDRFIVAAACLFLAGKVEETPKKIKDILNAMESIQKIKYSNETIENYRNQIIENEKLLLKILNFDLKVEHPYRSLMHYISILKKEEKFKNKAKELAQYAWNFVNDSFRTNLCLQFAPQKIAAACIYLSADCIKIELPNHWERDECFLTTKEENEKIGKVIFTLYEGTNSNGNTTTTNNNTTNNTTTNNNALLGGNNMTPSPIHTTTPNNNNINDSNGGNSLTTIATTLPINSNKDHGGIVVVPPTTTTTSNNTNIGNNTTTTNPISQLVNKKLPFAPISVQPPPPSSSSSTNLVNNNTTNNNNNNTNKVMNEKTNVEGNKMTDDDNNIGNNPAMSISQ
ncbi:hypothetical protein ABK040_000898 [Willaertia magna]